ncbi:MAG: hypothetical protein ABI373_10895, partial [Flavobacteriales bacterium]
RGRWLTSFFPGRITLPFYSHPMTTREQRKLVRTRIETGASPQQVYDELHGTGNAADEKLADVVRYVPTMERRAQYRTGQWLLMGLLCFGVAWTFGVVVPEGAQHDWPSAVFLSAFGFGYAVALVAVAKYWRKAHTLAGLLGFMEILRVHDQQDFAGGMGPLAIALFGVLAVLGFYLQRALTPAYIKLKEQYRNNEGQARLGEVVRFGD